ncbi:MAG: carbon-nitrogen hydrolase family protein [Firmicutes bacterium]|nr:carbon-nitrogen hydrolase family protein [Bacillota bacterium]HHY43109.1 carbon-nitrogen hydrolase family protein [Thermoanaerobacterales bacterium]
MKLGVCQMAVSEKVDTNTKKIIRFIEKAALHSINIVGFPEMALTGYTKEVLSDENLNIIVKDALSEIKKACTYYGTAAIVGHPYKNGDKLYNSASVFLPDGSTFTYDKKYPTELELKYFEAGKKEPLVFTYRDKKIGVMICRDQNYPELAKALKKAGAQFIYILSAHFYNPKEARWKLEKNRAIPITRAVENKVYVLLSNFVGSHLGMVSLGNSLISDPDGAVVVSAGECEEGLISVCI